jgi:IS66 Orf2 like protein
MIAAAAGVNVLVVTKPVDFRRGADSLAAVVREQLQHGPLSGTIFIFRSKRAQPAPAGPESSSAAHVGVAGAIHTRTPGGIGIIAADFRPGTTTVPVSVAVSTAPVIRICDPIAA